MHYLYKKNGIEISWFRLFKNLTMFKANKNMLPKVCMFLFFKEKIEKRVITVWK